jgi:hypothetical protein
VLGAVTSAWCRGVYILLYLHSFAFKYRYILYICMAAVCVRQAALYNTCHCSGSNSCCGSKSC